MNYSYKAIDPSGKEMKGLVKAATFNEAELMIGNLGLIPVDLKEQKGDKAEFSFSDITERLSPVRPEDLVIFTKQLRTMLKAGVNILRILDILTEQTENVRLKRTIQTIRKDLNEGASINEAFAKQSDIFSALYVSMIEAGRSAVRCLKYLSG